MPKFPQRLTLLRWMMLGAKRPAYPSHVNPRSEAGVTLLECLIAIVIIALTAAMITPPLFIAAATRTQNRRAEQAMQLAQGEIDRIQVLVSRGGHQNQLLPATVADINSVPPPTGVSGTLMQSVNPTCNTYNDQQIPATQVLLIDIDGVRNAGNVCQAEFMMQVFRQDIGTYDSSQNFLTTPQTARPTQFTVGVRVYSILANNNWANLRGDQASLQMTSGLGSQRVRPLAVLYNNISWSDRSFSVCNQNPGACP